MILDELFLLLIRWFHAMAAVTWLGGSLFYVLVLRPQQRNTTGQGTLLGPEVLRQFRGLVDICILVLVVTGAVLLFDRITDVSTSSAYIATLIIKIGLALWMFAIARRRWRQRQSQNQSALPTTSRWRFAGKATNLLSGVNLTVILGIAVFFLSDLLAAIFQQGLTGK